MPDAQRKAAIEDALNTAADWPEHQMQLVGRLADEIERLQGELGQAVADERQRIAEQIRSAKDKQVRSFGSDRGAYFAGWVDGLEDAARIVAAGSVPVATPEPCGWWDGPEDHVYGICNQPQGHQGRRHAETLADGSLWAEWGGGTPPPAPAGRGSATDPWLAAPTEV